VAKRLSRFNQLLSILRMPPKRLPISRKNVADLSSMNRYEWDTVNSESVSGLEVKTTAENVWLEACLVVKGDDVTV
jgi:hypothetical protein